MDTITEQTDVLVIGGGTAGSIAAIQAARTGLQTTLVEMTGQLGGTITSGGVNNPGYFYAGTRQVIAGIGWELVKKTRELDGSPLPNFAKPPTVRGVRRPSHYVPINRYLYAALVEEAAVQAGVALHYHETATEARPQAEGWTVTTVGKGVRRKISAREVIDCTADADIVGLLGFARRKAEVRQPGTLTFILEGYDWANLNPDVVQKQYEQAMRQGVLQPGDYGRCSGEPFIAFLKAYGRNQQHVPGADSSSSITQTEANIAGRHALLRLIRFVRTLPGCEDARIKSMCADVVARETYRIVGEVLVTQKDYMTGRVFPDAVCYSIFFVDVHKDQGGIAEFLPDGVVPTIPFGALIPRGSSHLLVAGRCLSSDRLANAALRVQPSCMAMGQAAGAAAALGIRRGCASRDVSLGDLRALLRDYGALVPEP